MSVEPNEISIGIAAGALSMTDNDARRTRIKDARIANMTAVVRPSVGLR